MRWTATAAVVLVLVTAAPAGAAAGNLVEADPGFGSKGLVAIEGPASFRPDASTSSLSASVHIAPDGSLAVLSTRLDTVDTGGGTETYQRQRIARLGTGGKPVTGFGASGILDLWFADVGLEHVQTLGFAADGRLLAAGYPDETHSSISLVALLADGSVDGGFGNGGFSDPIVKATDGTLRSVAITAVDDGDILLDAAETTSKVPYVGHDLLARFDRDGHLDAGFGGGGVASMWPLTSQASLRLKAVDDGDTFLRVGSYQPEPYDTTVAHMVTESDGTTRPLDADGILVGRHFGTWHDVVLLDKLHLVGSTTLGNGPTLQPLAADGGIVGSPTPIEFPDPIAHGEGDPVFDVQGFEDGPTDQAIFMLRANGEIVDEATLAIVFSSTTLEAVDGSGDVIAGQDLDMWDRFSGDGDGRYLFWRTDDTATTIARFEPVLGLPEFPEPDPDANSFTDDDGSLFEGDIEWLAAAGITRGCNPPENSLFCPGDPVTRSQMAAFLRRALDGYMPTDHAPTDFDDDDGSPFESDIEWMAQTGITRGCNPPDNTSFCPGDPVTRGQMAAFLRRALEGRITADEPMIDFDDDNAKPFESDIEWMAQTGITRGCNPPDNTSFCSDDRVTRGQMAAFFRRALE